MKETKQTTKEREQLLKDKKCPSCNEPLDNGNDNIAMAQKGEMLYRISKMGQELEYEQDEFNSNDTSIFFCRNCGKELPNLSEKDVLNIIK